MCAIFTGKVHASALGVPETSVIAAKGLYEGQSVDLHPESKSMIALAYEMDDCPTDLRVNRDKLVKRDIKDKKRASAKQKMLLTYINKLDRHRSTQQYSDYERRLNRIKQQYVLQNPHTGKSGRNTPMFDHEFLSNHILEDVSLFLDLVTDQDNILSYLQELEDFESAYNADEMAQCEKMLARLKDRTDQKSLERIEDLSEKIRALEKQITISASFKKILEAAQTKLRTIHGQEINDGYNINPKAADLLQGPFSLLGKQWASCNITAIYIEILCCTDPLCVINAIAKLFEEKSETFEEKSKRLNQEPKHHKQKSKKSKHQEQRLTLSSLKSRNEQEKLVQD